jgi:nucleotide-binding universal stress UspA family protein
MTQFDRPLVALSLTAADESLLQYAGRLSEVFAWRDVDFVHIAAPDRRDDWDPGPLTQQLRAEVARRLPEQLAVARGVASYHAARGSRIDQLLRVAVEHQRDLIVMGHRRMRSGRRSLARRAAMVAPCSVWLAPEGSRPQIINILVPTDFSGHSADALAVAIDIARAAGLNQVRALHVFFDSSSVRFDEHLDEVLGNEEAEFERFLAGVQTHGVAVEPMFHESTHPPEAILRVVQQTETDLIVMNTRGRSQAASVLLGSTTSDVISGTSVPLLAVKHYGSKMTLLQALLNHRIWEEQTPKSN